MHTNVRFNSDAFPPYPGEDEKINPGIWGKRLAEFIADGLPSHGLSTGKIWSEDWGWMISVKNDSFPIFIGCSNQVAPGGTEFLCIIDPCKPEIRKGLFKKIKTMEDVTRVVIALDKVLRSHPGVKDLQWFSNDEPV